MDIIIFAAISLFIAFKLRSQLGKISDDEKNFIIAQTKAREEKIIEIQKQISSSVEKVIEENIEKQNQINQKYLGNLDEPTKQTMLEILSRCKIDAEFFINGVKSCFEIILKAFATKDLEALKPMLCNKIYQGFENAINVRNNEGKNLSTSLILIEKTEILQAEILENQAFVTVKFISQQINYFTNQTGEIIAGKKDEIQEISDIWTFKKDLTLSDPAWIVSTTN